MTTTLLKTLTRNCLRSIVKRSEQIRLDSTFKVACIKEKDKGLCIEERKRTKLEDNQVRLQVHYCSLNSDDLLNFNDGSKQLPFTPGYELAGEVIEIGQKITNEQVLLGEKVAALSLERHGGFAQECVLDINDVFRLPSNVQLKEAAVLTSGHAQAMLAFSKMYELSKRDTVLISAGPAGLGLAAVDVAANVYNAKVIGVVDSAERAELLRERGAFQTLQYGKKLHKELFAATNKKGADVVYDAVGAHMIDDIGKCAAIGGRIFYAAAYHYTTLPAPPPNCNLTILSLLELRKHNLELYRCVVSDTLDLADQGVISAYVSGKFDFEDVNKAVRYIEDKKSTGKIVIKIID